MHAQQGLGLENGAIGNWSPIIHGLSKDHAVYDNQVGLLSGMIGGMTNRQNFKYFFWIIPCLFHDCGIQAVFGSYNYIMHFQDSVPNIGLRSNYQTEWKALTIEANVTDIFHLIMAHELKDIYKGSELPFIRNSQSTIHQLSILHNHLDFTCMSMFFICTIVIVQPNICKSSIGNLHSITLFIQSSSQPKIIRLVCWVASLKCVIWIF